MADHHYLTEDSTTTEWLFEIRDTPEGVRREIVMEDFVRVQRAELRRLVTRLSITYRLDRTTHSGDVESLVHEAFVIILKEVCSGDLEIDEITSFTGMVGYRAKSLVRQWIDSSAGMNTASRQVSLKRRVKEMRQTRDQLLLEDSVEPSAEKVVAETNKRMLALRKDAARQGMICTIEDHAFMVSGPSAELSDIVEASVPDDNEYDSALHSTERDTLCKLTIQKAYELSEIHGKVAEAFFGDDMAASFDEPPKSQEIADLIGIAAPTVRRKVAEVKELAQEVLKTYFGITGIDDREDRDDA